MSDFQERIVASVMPIHGGDMAKNLNIPLVYPGQIGSTDAREVIHLGLWGLGSCLVSPDTKLVLHWAGSDILQWRNIPQWQKKQLRKLVYNDSCNDSLAQAELKEQGIDATVCPFYPFELKRLAKTPMPDKFAVGIYAPTLLYHPELIAKIAARGYPVIVTGIMERSIQIGNVLYLGTSEYDKHFFYSNISVLVRMTDYDSLPRGLIEAAVARRHIITNYHMPDWDGGEDCINIGDTIGAVDKLSGGDEWKKPASKELSDRWVEKADPAEYKKAVDKLFKGSILYVPKG